MIQLRKQTIKVGNSAGVLLPRNWLGEEVTIILEEKPINIRKDIINLLIPYLEKVIGIYLTGSYVREEQEKESDIDILIITNKPIKLEKIEKYHIMTIDIDSLKRALENNPIIIYPMLREAKPILNEYLLNKLKQYKIKLSKLKWHIETSKSALKICKTLLNLEKSPILKATTIVYSLILRLKEAYLVECILKNKPYSNKNLLKWAKIDKKIYEVYKAERDNKPIPYEIQIKGIKKLYNFINNQIKKQEQLICQKEKKE